MRPTKLAPDFDVSIDATSTKLVMSEPTIGYLYELNLTGGPLNASDGTVLLPYHGRTLKQQTVLKPFTFGLEFEKKLVRMQGPLTPLQSGDAHDTTKAPHSTGGGRRRYVAAGFTRAVRGQTDGLGALKTWARDQENRPVGHFSLPFKYDSASGVAKDGWTNNTLDAAGWGIADPAHLETSSLFEGAVLGDRECLAHWLMMDAWIHSTFPAAGPHCTNGPKTAWTGSDQARAYGWMVKFEAQSCLLGLDTADQDYVTTFLAGAGPKKHLVARIQYMLDHPKKIGGDHPDPRTLTDISKLGYPNEFIADYGWAWGIMQHGVGYALRTGLINDPLKTKITTWMRNFSNDICLRVVGPTGMSYSFSAHTDFDQTAVDVAMQEDMRLWSLGPPSAPKPQPLELVPMQTNGHGCVRTKPRQQDSELILGGMSLLDSEKHPACVTLAAVCAKPTNMAEYKKIAAYADPYWALVEAGGTPVP